MIAQSKIFRTLIRQTNIVCSSHSNLFKKPLSNRGKFSTPITSGWVAPHILLDNILNNRKDFQPLIKKLYRAGLEDPLEERKEIKDYIKGLIKRYEPKTELDKGLLLFRAVISPFGYFESPSGEVLYALKDKEGGLCIPSNDDPNAPLREMSGDILPKQLMNAPKEKRVALCLEYSQLLVVMLRAAGISAHTKGEPGHAAVIAVLDGRVYKLDAAKSLFESTVDGARSDRESIAHHYLNKGANLSAQGKLEEAIEAYDIAYEIDPRCADSLKAKGDALFRQGKLDEAIKTYDKALEIDPCNLATWNNKGATLSAQGKLEGAIDAYDKALGIDPHNLVTWNNKGIALIKQGKLEQAIEAINEALGIDPRFYKAWNNKGAALFKQVKLDEAIEAYDKALAIDPRNFEAWNNKGAALFKLGKLEEAIKAYDKALEIDPRNLTAWNNKVEARQKLKMG